MGFIAGYKMKNGNNVTTYKTWESIISAYPDIDKLSGTTWTTSLPVSIDKKLELWLKHTEIISCPILTPII